MRVVLGAVMLLAGCKGASGPTDAPTGHTLEVDITLTGPAVYCDALSPDDLRTEVSIRGGTFTDDNARTLSPDHRTLVWDLPSWVRDGEQGAVYVTGLDYPADTVEAGGEAFFDVDLSHGTTVPVTVTCQAYYSPDGGV